MKGNHVTRKIDTSATACALASSLFLSSVASAAEYGRPVTVTSTLAMGASRPAYASGQNYILVYVSSAAWGTSTCRQDAAVIAKADTHLVAQLLTALQTGKTILFHVDDTLRPFDTVC